MIDYTSINIRTWAKLGSCGAFGMACLELPEKNDDLLILTADLCMFSGLERFKKQFPDRLYNIGIAEQNMVGIAAGLAKEGHTVFATTYASFAATRSSEQVRLHLGYAGFNVKMVGLTSGLSVGILGGTHIGLEDLSVMRSIPNMTVLSPADCTETVKVTIAAAEMNGPVYLRLTGPMNNPIVYKEDYPFEIGKAIRLKEGTDVALIGTGTMVYQAMKAAEELESQGVSACVIDMHTIKPLDKQAVKEVCETVKLVVTVEEHSIIGGLGSAVAEYKSTLPCTPPQLIIGIDDAFPHAGDYPFMLQQAGLTAPQIAEKVLNRFKEI